MFGFASVSVIYRHRINLGQGLAFGQIIQFTVRYLERPVDASAAILGSIVSDGGGERPQIAGAGRSNTDGLLIAQISVADFQKALRRVAAGVFLRRLVSKLNHAGLDVALVGYRMNHWRIIGAGQGNFNGFEVGTTVCIIHRNREFFNPGLTVGQVFQRSI